MLRVTRQEFWEMYQERRIAYLERRTALDVKERTRKSNAVNERNIQNRHCKRCSCCGRRYIQTGMKRLNYKWHCIGCYERNRRHE